MSERYEKVTINEHDFSENCAAYDNNIDQNNIIAVFGQGYVGLPLALSFAMNGWYVYGVDVDRSLVAELQQGRTNHLESYQGMTIQEILNKELRQGRYIPTDNCGEVLSQANTIVVTVGAPVDENGVVDNSPLKQVSTQIGKGLKPGDLVLMRSTMVPGATERVVKPILEQESGLDAEADFHLAYSSERIAEGKAFHEFSQMPTLVAGVTSESRHRAGKLLASLMEEDGQIIPSESVEAVELSKVLENLSRDINIAMVNEFAGLCEEMDQNIHHILDLANTHHRVNLLKPGPGVGGYCIPNAYYYLLPRAQEAGYNLQLSTAARNINDFRPQRIVDRTEQRLLEQGKDLSNCKVAVLGLAMKDYSSDHRNSPALQVVDILKNRGGQVSCFDPEVTEGIVPGQVENLRACVRDASVLIFLTRQREFDDLDYQMVREEMRANPHVPLLLDPKGALSRERATTNGIQYIIS